MTKLGAKTGRRDSTIPIAALWLLSFSSFFFFSDCVAPECVGVDVESNFPHGFYPYGTEQGDVTVPRADDNFLEVNLPPDEAFPFYGIDEVDLFINSNGLVTFGGPESSFTPLMFPFAAKAIVPFWADVTDDESINMGQIFYGITTTNLNILCRAYNDIKRRFSQENFVPKQVAIATWINITEFAGEPSNPRNTFQVIISTDYYDSFAHFIYGDINWSLGPASGNAYAQVGVNAGGGSNEFQTVAIAITPQVVEIDTRPGNIGTGEWLFLLGTTLTGACIPDPCENGGVCSVNTASFACDCPPQYAGRSCQLDNLCFNSQCQNGGSCYLISGGQDFLCLCSADYMGRFCESVRIDCDPNPCQNGGTCRFTGGVVTCQCRDGYTGLNCERPTLACEFNPCLNGGTCTEVGTGFECKCTSEYLGEDCKIARDRCESNPCRNGATCTSLNKPNMPFLCQCRFGYMGIRCEKEVCVYGNNWCRQDSRCVVDERRKMGYQCDCRSGTAGEFCEGKVELLKSDEKQQVIVSVVVVFLFVLVVIVLAVMFRRRYYRPRRKRPSSHHNDRRLFYQDQPVSSITPGITAVSDVNNAFPSQGGGYILAYTPVYETTNQFSVPAAPFNASWVSGPRTLSTYSS